ncbi:hypothetical protein Tco_0816903, partial [Tanacetum coccineum]
MILYVRSSFNPGEGSARRDGPDVKLENGNFYTVIGRVACGRQQEVVEETSTSKTWFALLSCLVRSLLLYELVIGEELIRLVENGESRLLFLSEHRIYFLRQNERAYGMNVKI